MPRAHLGKRLPDAVAIQLFAEHHIVHVRRRKNGEIVAVKHSTFGWMSPQAYYGLQKVHDIIPILGPVIQGAYQLKWAIASSTVSAEGISIPIGASFYGGIIGAILINLDAKDLLEAVGTIPALQFLEAEGLVDAPTEKQLEALQKAANDQASLLTVGLLAPFGEALLIWALMRMMQQQPYTWESLLTWIRFTVLPAPTPKGGGPSHGPGHPG